MSSQLQKQKEKKYKRERDWWIFTNDLDDFNDFFSTYKLNSKASA